MNAFARFTATSLLFVASAVLAQSAAPTPAERPTAFAEGDRWEWQMVITPDIGAPRAPTRTVVNTADGLRFQNHRGNVYGLAVPFEAGPFFNTKSLTTWRQWPLEVGKSWMFDGEFYPSIGTALLRQTVKVVAYEEVTVPAGTFHAFKIQYQGTASAAGQSWARDETYWYAPSARTDVKATLYTPAHTGIIELTALRPVATAATK